MKGKEARCEALVNLMNKIAMDKKKKKDDLYTWKGIECTLDELYWTLEYENHYLKKSIANMNYYKQTLNNLGFSKEQIIKIMTTGIYLKNDEKEKV